MTRPARPAVALLFASAALLSACRPEFIDPMKKQPKYQSYSENEFFPDGRAMRPTVFGTVPRERQLGEPAFVTGRTPDGKLATNIPMPLDSQALQRGRHHFEILCAACHGITGDGQSIPARKMSLRPPPSIHQFTDRPDGFFYTVITEGFGYMPSYADLLTVKERWEVVAYVRALQLSQSSKLDEAPPNIRQQLQGAGP